MSRTNPWSLFGIDLSRGVDYLALGLQQLLWSDAAGLRRRWYVPARLFTEGSTSQVCTEYGDSPSLGEARVDAIALPESLFLVRELTLPEAAEADLTAAVAMDIAGNSPFPSEERCSGWRIARREQGQIHVVIALASRAAVHGWLQRNNATASAALDRIEVWAGIGESRYVVLEGFGESARRSQYLQLLRGMLLRGLALTIAGLLALSLPVIAAVLRADQYDAKLSATRDEARVAARLREQLAAQRETLDALGQMRESRIPYHYWLHTLAAMAPDSVYMTRLEFEGRRTEATGLAANAADFLSQMADAGRFADIEAPGAFTRDRNSGLERFTITLDLPSAEEHSQ